MATAPSAALAPHDAMQQMMQRFFQDPFLSTATDEESGCYRTERAYGYFQRVVPLPGNAATDGVEANFDKGVLTVRVPKTEGSATAGKRIPIGKSA